MADKAFLKNLQKFTEAQGLIELHKACLSRLEAKEKATDLEVAVAKPKVTVEEVVKILEKAEWAPKAFNEVMTIAPRKIQVAVLGLMPSVVAPDKLNKYDMPDWIIDLGYIRPKKLATWESPTSDEKPVRKASVKQQMFLYDWAFKRMQNGIQDDTTESKVLGLLLKEPMVIPYLRSKRNSLSAAGLGGVINHGVLNNEESSSISTELATVLLNCWEPRKPFEDLESRQNTANILLQLAPSKFIADSIIKRSLVTEEMKPELYFTLATQKAKSLEEYSQRNAGILKEAKSPSQDLYTYIAASPTETFIDGLGIVETWDYLWSQGVECNFYKLLPYALRRGEQAAKWIDSVQPNFDWNVINKPELLCYLDQTLEVDEGAPKLLLYLLKQGYKPSLNLKLEEMEPERLEVLTQLVTERAKLKNPTLESKEMETSVELY